jgi:hypothetical protein
MTRSICLWFVADLAFAQTGYLTYPAGVTPGAVIATDLNGDGKPDLVVANTGSNSLTVLLNNGAGGFAALPPIDISQAILNGAVLQSIVAADLNGDGKTDPIVTAASSGPIPPSGGTVLVLLGDGDGTFKAPQPVTTCGGAPISIAVADLNGDGIPDLATGCLFTRLIVPGTANLLVQLGNGDGTFAAGTQYSLGNAYSATLALADFNQEGSPDIAVATDGALAIYLNNGKGSFTPIPSQTELWSSARGIAAADFNGDSIPDLAVSGVLPANANLGSITILLGRGDGTFQPAPAIETVGTGQLVAMDLNGDGHMDLAAGFATSVFFAGKGDGTFVSGYPFGGSAAPVL